jgi:hypothetical protein
MSHFSIGEIMSLATQPIKSATHSNLQAEIHYDTDPCKPDDPACTITYNSRSRYVLGNSPADAERDEAIARAVRSGDYIGMPVFAYVHGSVAIQAAHSNPFHCQWDSGRSGWAYMTKAEVRSFFGVRRITKGVKEEALTIIRTAVEDYSAYLNGEVYGFIIRDTSTGESVDSCWGFYGLDHVKSEAMLALKQMESLTPLQMELFKEGEAA